MHGGSVSEKCRNVVLLFLGMVLFGCARPIAPLDRNGQTPEDAVHKFIDAARSGSLDEARKEWVGSYEEMMDGHPLPSFADYCARFRRCQRYKLGRPFRTEAGFWERDLSRWSLGWEGWTEDGEHDGGYFVFEMENGEWKMNRKWQW